MNHAMRLFLALCLLASTLSSQQKSTLGDNAGIAILRSFFGYAGFHRVRQ